MPRAISFANLLAKNEDTRSFKDAQGESALSKTEPRPWVCANRICSSPFLRIANASEYCPQCEGYLAAGRGDLLDPVMYARCQRIIADECKADHKTQEWRDWCEDYSGYRMKSTQNPEQAWRALIGLPPLKSDEELDVEKDFVQSNGQKIKWRLEDE